MADERVTIHELREKVREFRRERGWDRDRNAKNKAISLVIEATEFLEHFQWYDSEQVLKNNKAEVVDELADVLYWVLAIADNLEIDLSEALESKMAKAAKKYPIGKISLEKYYQLRDKHREKR